MDLSEHRITVTKFDRVLFGMPAATGAAASPTPVGEYFVTDRIAFSGGSLGTFAFGISGIQPRLPAGWSGGNQLAIHGTNDPSSIGRSASAGCLRVSERSLDRLKPLLQLGTPVIVVRLSALPEPADSTARVLLDERPQLPQVRLGVTEGPPRAAEQVAEPGARGGAASRGARAAPACIAERLEASHAGDRGSPRPAGVDRRRAGRTSSRRRRG